MSDHSYIGGIRCGACGGGSGVVDSRTNCTYTETRRRRECLRCKARFTTYERVLTEKREDLSVADCLSRIKSYAVVAEVLIEDEKAAAKQRSA